MRIFGWTVPIETGWIRIGIFDDIPIPAGQVGLDGLGGLALLLAAAAARPAAPQPLAAGSIITSSVLS